MHTPDSNILQMKQWKTKADVWRLTSHELPASFVIKLLAFAWQHRVSSVRYMIPSSLKWRLDKLRHIILNNSSHLPWTQNQNSVQLQRVLLHQVTVLGILVCLWCKQNITFPSATIYHSRPSTLSQPEMDLGSSNYS